MNLILPIAGAILCVLALSFFLKERNWQGWCGLLAAGSCFLAVDLAHSDAMSRVAAAFNAAGCVICVLHLARLRREGGDA